MGHLYPHHGSENATEEGAERVQEPEDGQESSRPQHGCHATELKVAYQPKNQANSEVHREGGGAPEAPPPVGAGLGKKSRFSI